jgi:hypothetical protein
MGCYAREWGGAHYYRLGPGDLPLFCVGDDAREWVGAHYFRLGPGDLVLDFFDLDFFDSS